jgi:hypothetical protein
VSPYNESYHSDPLNSLPAPDSMSRIDEQADRELMKRLPDMHIVDQALLYYLEHCSFISERATISLSSRLGL